MENELLAALKAVATHPSARGLNDDAALFEGWVITHDMLVEGVHFLPTDPPEDVAWKLVAVNLSDLAAKGANPQFVLMGAGLRNDLSWNAAFVQGLGVACATFNVALIGGDTVSMPGESAVTLGLTAIGRAGHKTPSRSGALPDDYVFIAGVIGDAGLGLAMARGDIAPVGSLLNAYRRPQPLIAKGQQLAEHAHSLMDVSDGLLIDAARIAQASGIEMKIHLDAVPVSLEALALLGDTTAGRIKAATSGDDYALLGTAAFAPVNTTIIGSVSCGSGLSLFWKGAPVALPDRLGWLHS